MNLRNLFESLFNWIYPPSCVCCGKPGTLICDECLSELPPVGEHFCSRCGKPLKKGHSCRLCGTYPFRFASSRAPYLYEGTAAVLIKKLKYNGCLSLVPLISDHLAAFWPSLGWDVNLVIPVPLSSHRKKERGFNQSEMIARSFSGKTGISCKPEALGKVRNTLQQVGLNAEERRSNLSGAFAAEPAYIRGKRILLLDDVMTTGSTFAECSEELMNKGAESVHCLSFATTSVEHDAKHSDNTP